MELAIFSDIEFVGIAADRHIVMDASRRERRDSCSGSSNISLASVGGEVERHDQSLRASAFDIHEIYAVRPLSLSDLVLDWMPDTLVSLIEDGCDAPGDDNNLPATSSWSNNPSITLPLERYRRDAQRHERVAVSLVLGQACHLAVSQDGSVFKRSPAPSPSSRRGLEASSEYIDVAGDAITARSEADPDDHDYQSLLRTYSLERWFGSTMEKTQELAVELLQHAGAHAPQSMAVAHRQPYSRGTQPKGGEADRNSPSSSISLSQIECDPAVEANEDKDTGESIQAFTAAFKMSQERLASTRYRTHRLGRQRKRKSEDDHQQARPSRPSPAQLSDR